MDVVQPNMQFPERMLIKIGSIGPVRAATATASNIITFDTINDLCNSYCVYESGLTVVILSVAALVERFVISARICASSSWCIFATAKRSAVSVA